MTDEQFIKFMKTNPSLWGTRKGKKSEYNMAEGWVMVYNGNGDFSKTLAYYCRRIKKEKISEAVKSIANLPGAYVDIVCK